MTFIGIDNGVTGSIGILGGRQDCRYDPMPVKKVLNYTKEKQFLNRIDGGLFRATLTVSIPLITDCFCFIERPMVNPTRFKATTSALRALEATLVILEEMQIPYQFIDSKEWQRELLPSGLEQEELKFASLEVGRRLFPKVDFAGFKDADGLLIAEHCRRTKGGANGNS